LTGGLQLAGQGVRSSIQRANAQALNDFTIMPSATDTDRLNLLSDPQTSGGLLACIPPEQADDCLKRLNEAGIPAAAVGTLIPRGRRAIV